MVILESDYEKILQENGRLRELLKEADRLLSLSGVIFDPAPLRVQITAELK